MADPADLAVLTPAALSTLAGAGRATRPAPRTELILAAAVVLTRLAGTDRAEARAAADRAHRGGRRAPADGWRRELVLPRDAPADRVLASLRSIPTGALTLTAQDADERCHRVEIGLAATTPAACVWSGRLAVADLTERTGRVLRAVRARPGTTLRGLPVLTPAERALHAGLGAPPATPSPGTGAGAATVADPDAALRGHAALRPDAVALVAAGQTLTYAELDARVEHFAAGLRALGAGLANHPLGLLLPRSAELAIAILGALRAGVAFTALNPRSPAAHVRRMLDDAGAVLAVAAAAWELDQRVLTAAALMRLGRGEPAGGPHPATDPTRPAYVLFTSGSTGRPKGAVISRSALHHYLGAIVPAYRLDSDDRVLQLAEPGFDVLLEEVLASVVAGARVVVADPSCLDSPASFCAFAAAQGLTVVNLPSSLWAALFAADNTDLPTEAPPDLRLAVVGSERVPAAAYLAWHQRMSHRIRLVNAYGTTETTVTSLVYDPREPDLGLVRRTGCVPIGRPLANASVRVVDACGDPTPVGVAGELVIGGASVFQGYLDAPRTTPDYHTGDLVVLDATGVLLHAGRRDAQCKIRGRRIEPAEVEAALEALSGVRAALCTTVGADANARLVAAVVPATPAPPDPARLRADLAGLLPRWLVPDQIAVTAALPVNHHGKADRAAVATMFAPPPAAHTAPDPAAATSTEHVVAACVAAVLGCPTPAPGHNFFALGGNSVQAIRLVARLSTKLGRAIPARQVFLTPTVAEIARAIDEPEPARARSIVRAAARATFPLTPGQRAMLRFLGSPARPRPYFEMLEAFSLRGRLDRAALTAALRGVVTENEALRSTLDPAGQCQQVLAHWLPTVEQHDLSASAGPARERALAEVLHVAQAPFDHTVQPAFRATLARLRADEHVLALTFHHLFFDGWSYGPFYERLGELYAAAAGGPPAPPVPPRPQFGDYARWLAEASTDELRAADIAYWRDILAGYRPPPVCARAAAAHGSSSEASRPVDAATTRAVEALATSWAVTPFAALCATFTVVLSHLVDQADLLLASNDANRYQEGTEQMLGYLAVSQLSRVRLRPEETFGQLARRVHANLAAARTHMSVQWEELVAELGLGDAVQFRFSLQDTPSAGALALRGLDLRQLPEQVQSGGRRAIVVNAWRRRDGFELQWYSRDDLGLPAAPGHALAMFAATLARVAADPEQSVAALRRALAHPGGLA